MSNDSLGLDENDFEYVIDEIQEIMEDTPMQMRVKMLKTLSRLREKKRFVMPSRGKGREISKEEIYERILKFVEDDLEGASYNSSKFENIMLLTKLRENINQSKSN